MTKRPEGTSTQGEATRPATQQQKDRIAELAERGGEPIDPLGWPRSFSEGDAVAMIDALESALAERGRGTGAVGG